MRRPIQSVERAMRLLEHIAHADGTATLAEAAEAARIAPSTAHNLLSTLTALGYVQRRSTDSNYYLGARILNLARVAGNDDGLRQRFGPLMRDIADRFGESTYLIVPSGDELYYLDGLELANNPTRHSRLGRREPLSGSAIGLVLAAFMPGVEATLAAGGGAAALADQLAAVRRTGFANDVGGYQRDLHCTAVPLRLHGETVAGLCLNGAADRLPPQRLDAIARAMADMALRV